MEKCCRPYALCHLLLMTFLVQSRSSLEYTRQPPRPLIFTSHNRSDSDPQQVHISLVGKDQMKISWVTSSHEHVQSMVEYGKIAGQYQESATGEHTSYQYFMYRSGRIHHVTIGPLDPNTTYYYRCGGSGPEFNFRTPPSTFPIEFAIAGDLGQTEWTASTLAHIGAKDYDVLLLPGDLSYADTQQPLWDSFGRLVEPHASRRPWMVTQGNHEIETFPIIYPHGFKAYNARWPMPYHQRMLLSWLFFCFFARFGSLGDGRTVWFKIRWWISRLDICFATRHWLDDQKVVMKRKTELGGTFSIASWILFIGLFTTLLYQFFSKRTIEVHNLRATNAPELTSFTNEMEFNITTISSMSCSHLRGLDTLVTGSPSFIDHRIAPLSTFVNYSCHNSTKGPTITFKCINCQLVQDYAYISWQFVDLPNDPATAVGFQFNLTMKDHASKRRMSLVSGTVKNGSNLGDKPITFRGLDPNILKFNLFPRIYRNLHDLKLIQPLFHEFIPGSYFSEISPLQASLQSSADGLINTTICVNFLYAYIVEIDNENIMGPVSFLADLGGLYCISIGIFFYFLMQCEYRIKKLRNEDNVMRNIRSRRKAKENWDKLRKYVKYTWDCSAIDDEYKSINTDVCCTGLKMESFHKEGSSPKQRLPIKMDTISFNRKVTLPSGKVQGNEVLANVKAGKCHTPLDYTLPPPPPLEFRAGSEISATDIQKNLQNLYEYNVMLRENMNIVQSMINALTSKASSSAQKNQI